MWSRLGLKFVVRMRILSYIGCWQEHLEKISAFAAMSQSNDQQTSHDLQRIISFLYFIATKTLVALLELRQLCACVIMMLIGSW
jgi:hypothetical protein